MRFLVPIAVMVLGACSSSGPKRVGEQPSWRAGSGATAAKPQGPVTFAPSSEAAVRYNEPLKAPPGSALGDAVVAAVREAATRSGTSVPIADARLFRACEELAAVVPEEGVIGYSLVEFALQRNGIIEPSPHLLVVWGDIDSPQQIVEQLQPRLAEILADGATARVGSVVSGPMMASAAADVSSFCVDAGMTGASAACVAIGPLAAFTAKHASVPATAWSSSVCRRCAPTRSTNGCGTRRGDQSGVVSAAAACAGLGALPTSLVTAR